MINGSSAEKAELYQKTTALLRHSFICDYEPIARIRRRDRGEDTGLFGPVDAFHVIPYRKDGCAQFCAYRPSLRVATECDGAQINC